MIGFLDILFLMFSSPAPKLLLWNEAPKAEADSRGGWTTSPTENE